MSYPISFQQTQKQTQNLKQNQLLMMLPQMQQAISLLQSPILELSQLVDMEIEKNPLIEMIEERGLDIERESDEPKEVSIDDNDFEILKKLDDEYRDFFDQNDMRPRASKADDQLKAFLDSSVVAPETLYNFLLNQVKNSFETDREKERAELVVGSLDEKGYLQTSLEELAALGQCSEQEMARILEVIQDFEPYGIGARSVQECLLIQLKKQGKQGTLAEQLVKDCYDELLHNKIPAIQKKMRLTPSDIQTIIEDDIAKLDLHPGAIFSSPNESYIVPEGEIKEENGKIEITINEESIPRLRINRKYLRMLDDKNIPAETREYICQHLVSAKWLMKNIFQRNDTLRRVLEYLSKHQREYLLNPDGELVPMFMLEVAEELDLHESTIARAVAGKYIYTPRGLVNLRSLFTFSYKKEDGSEISSMTVRDALERVIEGENKKKPLSDQKISEKLGERGIPCARRTIAKYRQELNIGNAQQRRQYD